MSQVSTRSISNVMPFNLIVYTQSQQYNSRIHLARRQRKEPRTAMYYVLEQKKNYIKVEGFLSKCFHHSAQWLQDCFFLQYIILSKWAMFHISSSHHAGLPCTLPRAPQYSVRAVATGGWLPALATTI